MSIGGAARAAATDFYFNSWRFLPANLCFAAALFACLVLAVAWPPAVVGVALAGIPLAGIHRMAALVTRGEPTGFGDFIDGMRQFGVQATGLALGVGVIGTVLLTNALIGFGSDNPIGWFIAASAVYGLVALALFLVAAWPVLVDPARDQASLRRRLQLAGLLVVGRPIQLLLLTLAVAVLLAGMTLILAGIVLVGVAYASLFATRWVLPAVDALEARYEAARATR